jgi:hypothetical protein
MLPTLRKLGLVSVAFVFPTLFDQLEVRRNWEMKQQKLSDSSTTGMVLLKTYKPNVNITENVEIYFIISLHAF